MPRGTRTLAARGVRRAVVLAAFALTLAFAVPAPAIEPSLDIEGMTFVASRGEENDLVLWSRTARIDSRQNVAHLKDVRARVAKKEARPAFEMSCERGELDLDSNDFYAEGNVLGRTESGREFSADWVRYDHEGGLLYTDAPVLITESTGTYRGGGFRYHVREQRFRLLGGTSVVQEGQ